MVPCNKIASKVQNRIVTVFLRKHKNRIKFCCMQQDSVQGIVQESHEVAEESCRITQL